VFPFQTEYRFEFENNKLNGMGGKNYDY